MTSADDTTPLDPSINPLDGTAPGDVAAATGHEAPPSFSPPVAAGDFHTDPTVQVPVEPTAQFPVQPMAPMAADGAHAAVVRGARSSGVGEAERCRKSCAWALVAVLGIAAAAFAVLWVGKSSDADDLTKDRSALVAEVDSLGEQLATTKEELDTALADVDSARDELASATDDAAALQAQVDELTGQVADLSAQVEELEQAAPSDERGPISPELALNFGRALSDSASPPLTDEEATCLGTEVYNEIGFEALLEFGFNPDPTDADFQELFEGIIRATTACGLDFDRLD